MKIFIDTANIEQIKKINELGICDGVTTNPSLIAKEGRGFMEVVKDILSEVNGPVSVEVTATDAEGMVKEGQEYAKLSENVVIKIPMGEGGLKATKQLSDDNIAVNMTLIFSANQALLAAKAGARYVSPFLGRLDDMGNSGMVVLAEILETFDNYEFNCEVIAASIRSPMHAIESARLGAHIATIPFNVLEKMMKHPLTDIGIEKFLKDWEKVKAKNI